MADIHSKEVRSRNMAAVKAKNTGPELAVRKELHKRGYRYSLHNKKIPGTPDLFLRKYNTAIFIDGCFWHGHDCPKGKLPVTNQDFWLNKINKNKNRDQNTIEQLSKAGISFIKIWECEISKKNLDNLIDQIIQVLTNRIK